MADWYVPVKQTRGIRVSLVAASYSGVVLALGAGAVLLGVYWPELGGTAGALLLAVLAAATGGLGMAVAGGAKGLAAHRMGLTEPRHHIAGVMFAVAAAATAGAVGLLADVHAWFGAGAVGLVVAMLGYVVLPTVAGLVTACATSVVLAVSTVAEVAEPTPLSVGAALVVVGALFCLLSAFGPVRHRDFGVGLGAVVALIGGQQPLAEASATGWAYTLTFAVGVACFAVYRFQPAVTLLVVGLLGIGVAVLEATWDMSSGPVAIAVTLAATGVTLIGMGALGMRLWRGSGEPGLHRPVEARPASIAVAHGGPPDAKGTWVLDGTIVEHDRDRAMVPRGRRRR